MRWRAVVALVALIVMATATGHAQYRGWFIPSGGAEEKSPLAAVQDAAAKGKSVYAGHCARCHGSEGKGNGTDSDHAADLTDDLRSDINPDGVLFYKVWNGHSIELRWLVEDMPAFKDRLSRDQVWTVVEYLKVLRTPRR